MKVTVAQFAAGSDLEANAAECYRRLAAAADHGADLLVLPEGVMVRHPDNPMKRLTEAQTLEGSFVTGLREHSARVDTTVIIGIHERSGPDLIYNTVLALRRGEVLASYRKLHLYDAFAVRESDNVAAGDVLPPVFDCAGWSVGLLTCYDVRFPETARLLVDQGAELLALPAAWVRGSDKERHWEVMIAARALENTCFVAASGECGVRNIGSSMIVDPLATVVARLGARPGAVSAVLDKFDLHQARETLPVLANRRFFVDPTVRSIPIVASA